MRPSRPPRSRPALEALEDRLAPNAAPLAPPITEPASGRIVNAADVHMEAGPFSDPDPGDTHTASDWEIQTTAAVPQRVWHAVPTNGVLRVHIHLGDGAFEGPLAGRVQLDPDTDYRLRVRFRDSSGDPATEWGPWSERTFHTAPLTQVLPLETDDVAAAPTPAWAIVLPGGANPASLRLESAAGELLLEIRGNDSVTNTVTNPPALASHGPVRVRLQASADELVLPESDLAFADHEGNNHTVYLPALRVEPGQLATWWVSADGSTFVAAAGQTEPDFTTLARGAPVPWLAQPGYRVEVAATGFQLPVNIAFRPNPASAPDDVLYYVTELYGTIKAVHRNGTITDYATGLLNFNPTGAFPGSGEQGLTGIVVDPASGDVFASLVYSQVPFDDNAPHFPRVVRFHSTDGGRTAATQTITLDMAGETQGPSHQVSNLTFGPDGKLYVHNGDGFDASTGRNLDSFRGKVLRLNLDGTAPADNPFYDAANGITARDYVFAFGLRNPFGGAWRAADGQHYEVENGPSVDRFARIDAGTDYGYDGSDASMHTRALYNWSPSTAPVNVAFVQAATFGGSGFPVTQQDHAFVTLSGATWASGPQPDAKRIVAFAFDAAGNVVGAPVTLAQYTGSGKATAAALAAGPDGLYFSDLYRDRDYTSPIDRGASILRIRYVGAADFDADLHGGIGPVTVRFADRSDVPGADGWAWDFGDGGTSTAHNPSHTYTQDGTYPVRLIVTGAGGAVTAVKADFIAVGDSAPGLHGVYYDDLEFTGASVTRIDPTVDFNWGSGPPHPAIGAETFSVRWTGQVQPQFSETYTFYTTSDDGVRLWVNNVPVIDNWTDHAATVKSGTIVLEAGRRYDLRMEFYDRTFDAVARLEWSSASQAREVVPQGRLFSSAIPAAPTGLSAIVSAGRIDLAWEDRSDNEDGFRVERSSDGVHFAEVAAVAAGVTHFGDAGVSPGTTYTYRVRAVGGGLASAFSDPAAATTPAPPPTPPPVAPLDDNGLREVTALVGIDRRRPHAVRGRRFRQIVTVRNLSGRAIEGPLHLVLDGLPRGVRLLRRAGLTRTLLPGRPFVDLPLAALNPGESVTLTLMFRNPLRRRLRYLPRLLAGVGSV